MSKSFHPAGLDGHAVVAGGVCERAGEGDRMEALACVSQVSPMVRKKRGKKGRASGGWARLAEHRDKKASLVGGKVGGVVPTDAERMATLASPRPRSVAR